MGDSPNERFRKNWDEAFASVNPRQKVIDHTGPLKTSSDQADLPRPKDHVPVITQGADAEISRNQVESDSENSFHRKSLRVQWLLFWATLAAFCAAAYYARVAQHQADTMDATLTESKKQTKAAQDALEATKDNFVAEQRPYLWLTNTVYTPQTIPLPRNEPKEQGAWTKGQAIWTWHYTNYGKTPALNVAYKHSMRIRNQPFKLSFGLKDWLVAAPMPPTKEDFTTVVSEPFVLSTEEESKFFRVDYPVSISAVITYTDASNGKYETGFCMSWIPETKVGMFCKTGNYMK
jgi:hypothetical protein